MPTGTTAPNESLISRLTEDVGGQFVNLLAERSLKRTLVLTSAAYRLSSGRSATLRLWIQPAVVKLLRAAGRHGIAVSTSVAGPGGHPLTRAARMTLIPPRKPPRRRPRAHTGVVYAPLIPPSTRKLEALT